MKTIKLYQDVKTPNGIGKIISIASNYETENDIINFKKFIESAEEKDIKIKEEIKKLESKGYDIWSKEIYNLQHELSCYYLPIYPIMTGKIYEIRLKNTGILTKYFDYEISEIVG